MLRTYGDGSLFGDAFGEGPVRVVWLHGWARSSRDFAAAGTLLAGDGVASVALDLPGSGASPVPATAAGSRWYARVVAAALSEISREPVVLVGHSFGGRIATMVAADHPETVSSLVLTGVPLLRLAPSARPPWRYRLVRAAWRGGLVREGVLERARQRHGSADYRAATGVMRDVLVATVGESYEHEMARVTVPVHLLWGSRDADVPPVVAERARGLFAAAVTLRVLEGVGHFVPTEAPEDLVDVVRGELA